MPASPKKHQMETRSKTTRISNDHINNDDEFDEIDENGNIIGFIIDDNENIEDFDQDLFNKEIQNLKRPQKKRKLDSNNYSDMLLNLILSDANNKISNKINNNININETINQNINNLHLNSDSEEEDEDEYIGDTGDDTDSDNDSDINQEEVEEIINSANEFINNNNLNSPLSNKSEDDIDEETNNVFGNIIKEILRESDDIISEEEYEKLDEYDKQYNDLDNEETFDNNLNLKYFMNLNKEKKILILSEISSINNINNNNIPLQFKVLESNMDINTKSMAISHINKIKELDTSTTEYSKMEQWISGLIKIPFSKYINLPINDSSCIEDKRTYLKKTNAILDKAIFGHKNAKSHILQLISKWIKNPMSGGNILAIQGPMGNGKTTLVKEGIAKAINRPFAFIALGGASDSSFFDGHNYTYEGSHWGRIIEILIKSQCMNPVIYFDELDKVSDTNKGQEIIHLLTHLTDHSQNNQFQDNYFSGINIDLSKVLFIFSFNDESKVDRILKDRMYVINTKGFKKDEKLKIANDYLLPELLENFKYNDSIIFNDDIIGEIIDEYTSSEEGVRNLKRCLETIISKVNMYELLYDKDNNEIEIELPYKIKDFNIPYNVTKEVLPLLLNKSEIEFYKPPEHMYT